jgi:hypothetical protein
MFYFETDRRRTSFDPESGQAISNLPDPHAESCRYFAPRKRVDRSILRHETQDPPVSISSGGTPSEKSQKQLLLATQSVSSEAKSPGQKPNHLLTFDYPTK